MTETHRERSQYSGINIERVHSLLVGLDSATHRDMLKAFVFGSLHNDHEVSALAEEILKLTLEHLTDEAGRNISLPNLSDFIVGAADVLALGPRLRDLEPGGDLNRSMSDFFNALDRSIGAQSRQRLYTIHPQEDCYRGLLSRGMSSQYIRQFDVRQASDFGQTLKILFSEPPYKQIDQTSCYRLSAKDLKDLPEPAREWYENSLGLGTIVPETYTWEFTERGLAQPLCLKNPEDKEAYVCALSLDVGQSRANYEDRVLNPLLIRGIDLVFSSALGSQLAGGIAGVYAQLKRQTLGRVVTQTKFPAVITAGDAPSLDAPFKAVPGGDDFIPWAFAEGDDVAEEVYEQWRHLRMSDGTVCVRGPSGVGKELIAHALHFHGHRKEHPFIKGAYGALESKTALAQILGSHKGAFTDACDSESDFERADRGTYFINEIYVAQKDIQKALLDIVQDVRDKRGFDRMGPRNKGDRPKPDVRVIFGGDPASGKISPHLEGRLGTPIDLPSWEERSRASRIVGLRYHLLSSLVKLNRTSGRMSLELFRFILAESPHARLRTGNMRMIFNWFEKLKSSLSGNEGEPLFTLADLVRGDKDLRSAANGTDRNTAETFPDELMIGEGSYFERRLTAFEKLVIKISKCKPDGCSRCVDDVELAKALEPLGTASKTEAFEAHYMLLAATSGVERDGALDDDRHRTAPGILEGHFRNAGIYRKWCLNATTYLPGQLKIKGEKNDQFPGGPPFKHHVESVASARLLVGLERVACAYPPLLGEGVVPYWLVPPKKNRGKIA